MLAALAAAQAELGMIPASAAAAISERTRVEHLDLDRLAEATRTTGHSTLGLIHELRRVLPADAHPWVYYGATVQDVTDTATALIAREVARIVRRDLHAIEDECLRLADAHRASIMVGRTHGQPGAPITFGWKAASWADEIRRHLDRLHEGAPRWIVGQLGGAVGTLAFFGDEGPELRRRFCARLELGDPTTSWLSSRDRIAEFAMLLTLVAGTLGRIGNEVYQLQREELGELREATAPGTVGSITMPHKRNPEIAEHLVTLSRLARANGSVLLEGLVSEHERDGRSWKAEWIALPELSLLTGTATHLGHAMLAGLEVDVEAMRRGVSATRGRSSSDRLLAVLAPRIGKHRAQELLQTALTGAADTDDVLAVVARQPDLREHLTDGELDELTSRPDVGATEAMIDAVIARSEDARTHEPRQWP